MIKLNLTQRIWFSFIAIILMVGLLIGIIYPISLKSTLTEETYRIIEQQQAQFLNSGGRVVYPDSGEFLDRNDAVRSVGHIRVEGQYSKQRGNAPFEVIQEMIRSSEGVERRGRFELTYNDGTIFYVVFNAYTADGEVLYISYMWDTYRDQMVNRLWSRLFYIMVMAGLLSLIPAFWLKHYLKQPLLSLGNHFEQIAERNWKEPFHWESDDDFEKLSNQFEQMRQNLIKYDGAQKTFIQHASHELKTPIMVVKSYAQSVKDGVLPKENISSTMDVILEESERMEKRVKDMLYYTKLDSLQEATMEKELFAFGSIAYQMEERFRMQREDIEIRISGEKVYHYGDVEQLQILLENLVENALRYAESFIEISASETEQTTTLEVSNDGEKIPEKELEHLFTPFRKGNKGQFGLGLAIVKSICELHKGYPEVKNNEKGVSFTVVLPKKPSG
ncbi:sensor histidine kinase [Alteribacter natronophilus]|uniref:sensor histidine kinase n=1 Tax=Alteribacter natronophilus TaxID=2583810 RepID=UPI00110E4FCD|nr:HAMP domain-containing sensor histidine kinase [Alteribacter natronophilus]TMW74017.1 HAMP domain-containing histidine kinase [Alteribacter natronophilus]